MREVAGAILHYGASLQRAVAVAGIEDIKRCGSVYEMSSRLVATDGLSLPLYSDQESPIMIGFRGMRGFPPEEAGFLQLDEISIEATRVDRHSLSFSLCSDRGDQLFASGDVEGAFKETQLKYCFFRTIVEITNPWYAAILWEQRMPCLEDLAVGPRPVFGDCYISAQLMPDEVYETLGINSSLVYLERWKNGTYLSTNELYNSERRGASEEVELQVDSKIIGFLIANRAKIRSTRTKS